MDLFFFFLVIKNIKNQNLWISNNFLIISQEVVIVASIVNTIPDNREQTVNYSNVYDSSKTDKQFR